MLVKEVERAAPVVGIQLQSLPGPMPSILKRPFRPPPRRAPKRS